MNRTVSLAILGLSTVVLGACADAQQAQPQAQAPAQAPTAQVPVVSDVLQGSPTTRQQAPGISAAPTTGCQPPRAGQYSIRTQQIARDGSLQVQYSGRDPSYRTNPYVYMFLTNATLLNRDGSIRDNASFGLWQGQAQEMRVCGRAYSVDLVRVTESQVTITLRPH
jgi:hypothetical protein